MGNSQTKEARGRSESAAQHDDVASGPVAGPGRDVPPVPDIASRPPRNRRPSRPDFTSFLGIGGSSEQDTTTLEQRRENKLEREARRAERERQARLKEREQSMRDEHVDGGYLVTQGVYVGTEDYSKQIVRQLMIERRLAPFWRGLNEYSTSWAEHQLMAAARGMPIPPPDQVPPELEYSLSKKASQDAARDQVKGLTIPISSRSQSFQSEQSAQTSPVSGSLPVTSQLTSANLSSPGVPLFRTRAKTLASLTSSRNNESKDMTPREYQLPSDPFVNGQPIEVYLYKDADECPICFLSYPPYLNTTRCCEQSICSECFVQIKRPDPHPPEHETPDPNAPPVSEAERIAQAEGLLVSEVATCPYCKTPEFGITYNAPPFRRGLTHGTGSQPYQVVSAMSSQTSISSGQMSPTPARKRGTSLSATAPEVITTDKIRPDWASKLAAARAHAARRSAAATALHTAAYLMNNSGDRSAFPSLRRGMLRRGMSDGDEAQAQAQAERHLEALRDSGLFLPPPRGSSSRRNRVDDLEEIMMMEAIRLSLASEEERRRKEEKEAKKKAKKEEKENKKAEKAAKKTSPFAAISAQSSNESPTLLERPRTESSSLTPEEIFGKGKGVERTDMAADGVESGFDQTQQASTPPAASTPSQESLVSMAIPSGSEPFRRSHLRHMSTTSSTSSSFIDQTGSFQGSSTPPGNAPTEPMFNFRSLTAMINQDEKPELEQRVEHAEDSIGRQGSFENLVDRTSTNAQGLGSLEREQSEEFSKQAEVDVTPSRGLQRETTEQSSH